MLQAALVSLLLVFASHAHAQCRLTFSSGIEVFPVALAHTPEQLKQGLSGRETIAEGMLFVWSEARQLVFWMKNTHQPLTLYYLDQGAVIQQSLLLKPFSEQYHYSDNVSRYALELPEPMAKAAGLNLGDRLERVLCHGVSFQP